MKVLLKSFHLNGHTLNRLHEVSLACLKVRAILDVTIYKIEMLTHLRLVLRGLYRGCNLHTAFYFVSVFTKSTYIQ